VDRRSKLKTNKHPPLHRSLTFWAGLLVVTFTCWAWWDSCSHISRLQRNHLVLGSVARGAVITYSPGATTLWSAQRLAVPSYPSGWPQQFFPAPFLVRANAAVDCSSMDSTTLKEATQFSVNLDGPGTWSLYLPFWIILLPILIPWSLLLLWRARRLKRATIEARDPSPI
jgi:hypothetical protein